MRLVPSSDPHQAMAALQALAGPSSPLDTLLGVLRTQTDLPVPGSQPETASRSLAASVVTSTTGSLAGAVAKATLGEGTWPGTTIGNAFRPLTELVTPPPGGGQPIMARIRELFSAAYGAMSTVSTATNAKQAAFQAVARRGGAAADAIIQLRADSALRPEPVRGIMRGRRRHGIHGNGGRRPDPHQRGVAAGCDATMPRRHRRPLPALTQCSR